MNSGPVALAFGAVASSGTMAYGEIEGIEVLWDVERPENITQIGRWEGQPQDTQTAEMHHVVNVLMRNCRGATL